VQYEEALKNAVKEFKESQAIALAERDAAHGEERAKLTEQVERLGTKIEALEKAAEDHVKSISLPGVEYDADGTKEKQAFSIFRAMQLAAAQTAPDKFGRFSTAKSHGYEREVMEQAEKRGMEMPGEQRTYNVGTDQAGGVFVPMEVMFDSVIPQLEAQSVIRRAGATSISGLRGNLSWIVEEGGSVAYYVDTEAEESVTESVETFSTLNAQPHTMAAMQKFSHKQLLQSAVAIEPWARGRIATKFALREDLTALTGTGTASQPRGLLNVTGLSTVDFETPTGVYSGATQTLSGDATEMVYTLKNANAYDPAGKYAWVAQPEVGEKLSKALDADGRRLFLDNDQASLDRWMGYSFLDSTQFDSGSTTDARLIFGDWSKLLLLQWGAMRIQAVQEGDDAKKLRMSIIGSMDHDVLCTRIEAFALASNFDLDG